MIAAEYSGPGAPLKSVVEVVDVAPGLDGAGFEFPMATLVLGWDCNMAAAVVPAAKAATMIAITAIELFRPKWTWVKRLYFENLTKQL